MAVNANKIPARGASISDQSIASGGVLRVELSTLVTDPTKYRTWRVVNAGDTDITVVALAGSTDTYVATATEAGRVLAKEGAQYVLSHAVTALSIRRLAGTTESDVVKIYPIIPYS